MPGRSQAHPAWSHLVTPIDERAGVQIPKLGELRGTAHRNGHSVTSMRDFHRSCDISPLLFLE